MTTCIALLVLLAYSLFWPQQKPAVQEAQTSQQNRQQAVVGLFEAGAGQSEPPPIATRAFLLTPVTAQVLSNTSLAGTSPDGDWSVDARGQLRVSRSLRQRFDYFLGLIGEMSVDDLRALVQREAQAGLQPASVEQVMAMWDRYVRLQQHKWRVQADLHEPSSWSAALTERQQVRRELLGADWAYAFYDEDDRQLQQMVAQLNTGGNVATNAATSNLPGESEPALHPDAAQREAQVQTQWRQWEQRLVIARAQVQALQTASEQSAAQRQQAVEQYLNTQFSGTELLRARGLLGF